MPVRTSNMHSRRDFLKSGGALIVSFSAASLTAPPASGQGQFDTHSSHIDPKKLDAWVAVGADGAITAYTGKCDFGQGIFTAQTQLVAEELYVQVSRVKLIQCDTAITPDQGTTSGSQSTPANFNSQNLALAAATAREALLRLAADRLAMPIDHLTVTDGVITDAAGRRVTYQELVGGKHFNLTLSPTAKRRSPEQWTVLGKPVPSLDRVALMIGQFEFVHSVRVPRMVHGRVVRPPEMGATVASVDQSSVRHIPGVLKVVVRKDFVGVVAETQYQAGLAARQLVVRWNPGPDLPAQKGFFEYLQKQPSHDALSVDSGDVERELAAAGSVLRASEVYLSLPDARFGRRLVCRGRCQIGPGHRMVCDAIGLSDTQHRGQVTESAARECTRGLRARVGMLRTERRRCRFVRCGDPLPISGKAGPSAVLTTGRNDVGEPRRGLRRRAPGRLGIGRAHCRLGPRELGSFLGKSARL